MNLNHLWSAGTILALGLCMGSCVDENYDLSDIDTTSRIYVNDLTIPVNIDPITLGDIIKIDEGSKIQSVTIDGKEFYALREKGSFSSSPIDIAGVSAAASPIAPISETLEKLATPPSSGRERAPIQVSYPLVEMGNVFDYSAANIDPAIVKIDKITTAPFGFTLTMEISDPDKIVEKISFTDLVIAAPKGLYVEPGIGSYEKSTGLWTIPEVVVAGNKAIVTLTATGVDMDEAGASILPDRSLDFKSQFIVKSGYLNILASKIAMPDKVRFNLNFGLSDFMLKTFSGILQYDITGVNIPDVVINDLPDFLTGGETNLNIANPQIYFSINNPVANVPLSIQSGIQLETFRTGLPSLKFNSDELIKIGANHGVAGPYNYVLSPNGNNNNVPAEFAENLTYVPFTTLGSILATPADWAQHGLPNKIGISLVSPRIPQQQVTGFSLPTTIAAVDGRWELLAPLAVNDGSKIIYTEVRDGWGDETLDDLTITNLTLTADAENQCPVNAQLTVYPIDRDGNEINGAIVKSTTLRASDSQQLSITMTGEVKRLDGIRLVAVLEGTAGEKPLDPAQILKLTNIRVTVGGYYQKKF